MTKAELQALFYRLFDEASSNPTISTANADLFLQEAYREIVSEYNTYLKTKAVPVAAKGNEYDRSDVIPTLAAGESVDMPLYVQYQRCESGSITAAADAGGGEVQLTSASHGLSEDDRVFIFDTDSYNGLYQIALPIVSPGNNFKITATYVDDETGAWAKQSQFNRTTLNMTDWGTVERSYDNVAYPNSVPFEGILLFTWPVTPETLPASGDIDQTILPQRFHALIALEAFETAGGSLADERLGAFRRRAEHMRSQLEERKPTSGPVYMGSTKFDRGVYAFRATSERTFIFHPGAQW